MDTYAIVLHPALLSFPGGSGGKEPALQCRRHERSLAQKDPLEKGTAAHPSIMGISHPSISWLQERSPGSSAWRISWTEEPGGSESVVPQRVRHNWSNLVRAHALLVDITNQS